jgi:hypothetical protein
MAITIENDNGIYKATRNFRAIISLDEYKELKPKNPQLTLHVILILVYVGIST